MSDGVALVILLTAAEISDPTTVALEHAARDVLGGSATISVLSQEAPVTDEAALARAGAADGVVEIAWDEEHRTAELHCYLVREHRWLDRTITFDRDDADSERGRLLGFAIGSMLVAQSRSKSEVEVTPPPIATAPVTKNDVEVGPFVRAYPGLWLEVGGNATTGIGGSASALGVSARFRFRVASTFRFVSGVHGLFGEVEEAQATHRSVLGSAGLAWQPYEPRRLGEFGFAMRTELFAGWLEVSHLSEDDPAPDRQSRFLAGGRGFLEASLGISESSSTYAALGPMLVAGRTDIYTHGSQATTIPVVWLMAELGVQAAF